MIYTYLCVYLFIHWLHTGIYIYHGYMDLYGFIYIYTYISVYLDISTISKFDVNGCLMKK